MSDKKVKLSAESIGDLIAMVELQFWGKESAQLLRDLWREYAHALMDVAELKEENKALRLRNGELWESCKKREGK